MNPPPQYALSVKQPWAALIMCGLKTIEIRRWPTARRGRVFIHAARSNDDRPQGWERVTESVKDTAQLQGGLLGTVEITGCLAYRNKDDFLRDSHLHLNDPSWYDGSQLYGFCFSNPVIETFQPLAGWFRFFRVDRPIKNPKPVL
jgi:hypothetical protein